MTASSNNLKSRFYISIPLILNNVYSVYACEKLKSLIYGTKKSKILMQNFFSSSFSSNNSETQTRKKENFKRIYAFLSRWNDLRYKFSKKKKENFRLREIKINHVSIFEWLQIFYCLSFESDDPKAKFFSYNFFCCLSICLFHLFLAQSCDRRKSIKRWIFFINR